MANTNDCWLIASIDEHSDVKILKRSPQADDYLEDSDEFMEYTLGEMARDMPAGVFKLKIEPSDGTS